MLRRALLLTLPALLALPAAAQSRVGPAPPVALPAVRLGWPATPMRLDGALDEPAWATVDSVSDFTQRDPIEGRPASERTVVRLIGTGEGLWVGLWAYEAEPVEIRRAQLRRDAHFDSDDSFAVMIDAQRDRRSGFVFAVNPNGAMQDAEVLNFENENRDWDGVWDARARVTPWGWQAELFIPWQTLRYPAGGATWGINFRRFVRHLNEEVLWRAWRRPEGLRFLEREGTLEGLRALPPRALAEFRPYVVGTARLTERDNAALGAADSVTGRAGLSATAGFDIKLAPSPTLTLDLTANTDFAQAEADRQVVNLSRFPLFFPEQRTFFTEGAGIFDFGRARQTQLFYSRRIGLDTSGAAIPLHAGARLIGRIGSEQVGLLAVRTGGAQPATDVVARVKHDVLGRGYVGAMATMQQANGRPLSPAGGADFNLPYIVNGQNLVLIGTFAAQRDSAGGNTASYTRFVVDYPNDNADIVARYDRVGAGFAPPLGFVSQSGINRYAGSLAFTPRPGRWNIRKLSYGVESWNVVTNLDNTLNNANIELRPLGIKFESGDEVEVNLQRNRDVPGEAFELFPGTVVGAGSYQWNRAEVQVQTSQARTVSAEVKASAGGFYDGHGTELQVALRAQYEPHLLTSVEYQVADFHRNVGAFTATTVRLRVDYAASPRLTTTFFGQYDNDSKRVAFNARARWTRAPGSDTYVVWNSAWPSGLTEGGIPWERPASGALIVKVVEYFRR
jgi:hypothetical protein